MGVHGLEIYVFYLYSRGRDLLDSPANFIELSVDPTDQNNSLYQLGLMNLVS